MAPKEYSKQESGGPTFTKSRSRRIYIALAVVCVLAIVVVALVLGIYFGATRKDSDTKKQTDEEMSTEPTPTVDKSFGFLMTLDQDFTSDLDNPNTTVYQTLKTDVEALTNNILRNSTLEEWYIRNTVIGFRYGSTVAEVKVDFSARIGISIVSEEVSAQIKKGFRENSSQANTLRILVDETIVQELARTGNVPLGGSCTENNDCSDRNSFCGKSPSSSLPVCHCVDGYYDSNFENNTGGICRRMLKYEESSCWEARHCSTSGAVCSYNQCICNRTTHILKDDACVPISAQASFCPRNISNSQAVIGQDCIDDHRLTSCTVSCQDGYRIHRPDAAKYNYAYIFCDNGTWSTSGEDLGYAISNICLPEGEFRQCPLTISNGSLEEHCGPETDWLCSFKCNDGYRKHIFMSGELKTFIDDDTRYKLKCQKGEWKTGYEDVGLDNNGLCYPLEQKNCTADIPNGDVHRPCPSGYLCNFQCKTGYRMQALAKSDWPSCLNGEWKFAVSKFNTTITPATVCIPEASASTCTTNISNGHIPDSNCKVDCKPECDDGFYVPSGVGPLTCENGSWLTKYSPYTGSNYCFPNGGYNCSFLIPNGSVGYPSSFLKDIGDNSRIYISYTCNEGFRRHRAIDNVECVAGTWITMQERFGIDVNSLCIPFTP